jgi:hypothetical protein
MEFDDFFDNKRRFQGSFRRTVYHDNKRNTLDPHRSHQGLYNNPGMFSVLSRIRSNQKLKRSVMLAGLLILSIVVILIIVLLPSIGKLFDYISQNGLKGLLDGITGFLDKILKNSRK